MARLAAALVPIEKVFLVSARKIYRAGELRGGAIRRARGFTGQDRDIGANGQAPQQLRVVKKIVFVLGSLVYNSYGVRGLRFVLGLSVGTSGCRERERQEISCAEGVTDILPLPASNTISSESHKSEAGEVMMGATPIT